MRTTAFAIALLLSGAAFAQTTTTTTQPDVDVDVGVQPDGDPDIDLDVGTNTKTTTYNADGTVVTSTTDNVGDDAGTTETTVTTGTTTTGTMTMASAMPAASGPIVQPSNANPEHDARGIAVISDPAVVPAGWNGITAGAMGGPLVDPATGETLTVAADASYPACTATVTDNCLQTYERNRH